MAESAHNAALMLPREGLLTFGDEDFVVKRSSHVIAQSALEGTPNSRRRRQQEEARHFFY